MVVLGIESTAHTASVGLVDERAEVTRYVPQLSRSGLSGATVRQSLDMYTGVRAPCFPSPQEIGTTDEATLKQIASMTGGDYYTASSAQELQKVLESLPTYLIMKHDVNEISVFFAAFGALLAVLAIALSQLWRPLT